MEDLSSKNTYPFFWNFSVGTTLTKIIISGTARKVTIGSNDKALFLSQAGSIEGSAPPSNKAFIPKSNYLSINMGRGSNRENDIYVCSQSGSAEVSIILEEE